MAGRAEQKQGGGRDYLALGGIILLIVFHTANNYLVLSRDTVYFQGDSAESYVSAVRFLRDWSSRPLTGKIALFYVHTSDIRPPLFEAVSALLMSAFGVTQDVALLANIPFLAVLIVSTYLLGRELFNREIGLLAAVLLSFFPAFFSLSRSYMSDFSVAAMATLSLLLLVKADPAASRRGALLLGVVLGLTALTQPFFSLFLLGPFVIRVGMPFCRAFSQKDKAQARRILLFVLLAGAVSSSIALPWYILHARGYFELQGCRMELLRSSSGRSFPSAFLEINPWSILSDSLLALLAGGFFVALACFILRPGRHKAFLLSWLLVPYLVFIPLGVRYRILLQLLLFPLLPGVAFILSILIYDIILGLFGFLALRPATLLRGVRLVIVLTLLADASVFLSITYAGGGDLFDVWGRGAVGFNDAVMRANYLGRTSPHEMGSAVGEVVGEILHGPSDRPPEIFVLNPSGPISEAVMAELEVAATLRGVEVISSDCLCPSSGSCIRACWVNHSECMEGFLSADYAILEPVTDSPRDYEIWWDPEDKIIEERLLPLSQEIMQSLPDYVLLEQMPRALVSRRTSAREDGAFGWLNDSAWVLKKMA